MSAVVHEIRNQIAILCANLEAFRDGKLAPTPARIEGLMQSLDAIDVLLNDVEPAAIPRAEAREIDLCEVIDRQLAAIEAVAERRGVALSVQRCSAQHNGPCQHFIGDPVRIEEILSNVLLNAVRYTPAGGAVRIGCFHRNGELRFSVADDGPGIDLDEIDRIFESGYRGKSAGGTSGSGLGLAISREFAREHGGTITVENNPAGRGALFTIHLPGIPGREIANCATCVPEGPVFIAPS